jgi:hypothetical protein
VTFSVEQARELQVALCNELHVDAHVLSSIVEECDSCECFKVEAG